MDYTKGIVRKVGLQKELTFPRVGGVQDLGGTGKKMHQGRSLDQVGTGGVLCLLALAWHLTLHRSLWKWEEDRHSEKLLWARDCNPLNSQGKKGHFLKQPLLDCGWGLRKERPNC